MNAKRPPERARYDDYPTCARTYVTLCLTGENLDPDAVTREFGLEPTETNPVGAIDRWGTANTRGGWFLTSRGNIASADAAKHLRWLVATLEGRQAAIQWAKRRGWQITVSCFWGSAHGHGSPELDPDLMRALAELDLSVWFDVYFLGDD